jgi:outer membrane protein assembly factor BamB
MSRLLCTALVVATLVLLLSQSASAAENWPQWRGPLGTGVADDGNYPVTFNREEGLTWKVELPGVGSSTPAVWGENIFVTCGIDGQDGLVCYDMGGQEKWRRQFGEERKGKHRNGSGSNPSPTTDGRYVVVYFKSGTLACLDRAGTELWKKNLQDQYGQDTLWWDLGTSPVLAGDRVIVAVIHEGQSYLAAFNLADGSVAWKVPRQYERPREADQAYTTPQLVKLDDHDVIVTWGADHLTGHDAANGKLLWECGGFNPDDREYWRVIASATASDGIAVVPFGRGNFLAGVRLGGSGDVTDTARIWEQAGRGIGSDVPTPVVSNGRAYVLSDRGQIFCRDLESGEEQWKADLPRNVYKYYSSPVLAGDKLYCVREDGTVFVGRVTNDGFELLADNELEEQLIASPVPVRDKLLIRGAEHLFCAGPTDGNESQRGG